MTEFDRNLDAYLEEAHKMLAAMEADIALQMQDNTKFQQELMAPPDPEVHIEDWYEDASGAGFTVHMSNRALREFAKIGIVAVIKEAAKQLETVQ